MDRFVAFVCNFLCAAALFGSSGNLAPETQEEDRGPAQGAVVQNKAPSVIGCPVARYPVRFGRDKDANLIDLSAFTRTTVEEMRSWPTPGVIPPESRISPYETTVLALEATLIEYQRERDFDDSDYRLVLADESGRTIIAKISSSGVRGARQRRTGVGASRQPVSGGISSFSRRIRWPAVADDDSRARQHSRSRPGNRHVRYVERPGRRGSQRHPTGPRPGDLLRRREDACRPRAGAASPPRPRCQALKGRRRVAGRPREDRAG